MNQCLGYNVFNPEQTPWIRTRHEFQPQKGFQNKGNRDNIMVGKAPKTISEFTKISEKRGDRLAFCRE